MCGIAGIISEDPAQIGPGILKRMTDSLAHRGPDGEGSWISPSGMAGLGNRRLSIVDRGPSGAQPMHYRDRYTIVHNGEIYNYVELREDLSKRGYRFSSRTDTEIILAAFDHYGPGCLEYFDGMFAFAIWDEVEKKLFLARDRIGEKPLFIYQDERRFVFASEMKALWAAGIQKEVNRTLLYNFLTLGYTQDPGNPSETFYTGISRLPPRSYLLYDAASGRSEMSSYWDIELENTREITEGEAIDQFRELLTGSVNRRLRSDTPYGASVSGGLDSSSIVATILGQDHERLATGGFGGPVSYPGVQGRLPVFSAVFPGFEKDESSFIQTLSSHFPLDNHFVTPTAEGLVREWETLSRHQEEPFLSTSIYAQFKVFGLARQQGVPVLLDGQGADEILAGYHKYYHWYWQELFRSDKQRYYQELKSARALDIRDPWSWKNKLAARWPVFAGIWATRRKAAGQKRSGDLQKDFIHQFGKSYYQLPHFNHLNGALYYNTFMNGLEELLRYADRNSMAHGVEVRLPFLDHKLLAFVFSLPAHFKIKEGWTKWLLRKTMEPALPTAITWRKDKIGYEPPQQAWMDHPVLAGYLHEAKKTLVRESILQPAVLDKKNRPLGAHAAGNEDWRWLVSASTLFS